MEEEKEVEDVQYKRLYVDDLFVSVIVVIIIASIFDFNGNGGIINGVGGGEDVQYKLICRLYVLFQSLFPLSKPAYLTSMTKVELLME